MGNTTGGAIDASDELARAWLRDAVDPTGRPNRDVLGPSINGVDVARSPRGLWIVDVGGLPEETSAIFYKGRFQHAPASIRPAGASAAVQAREVLVAARAAPAENVG